MTRRKNKNKSKTKTSAQSYGKPTAHPRGPPKGPRRAGKSKAALCKKICDGCDPFCMGARGSKRHTSSSSTITVPYSSVNFTTLHTDANGAAAFYLNPSIQYQYAHQTSITVGGGVTWDPVQTIPNFSEINLAFGSWRVVSFGVRIFGSAALSESQGVVSICTVGANNATAGAMNINSSNYMEILRLPISNLEATWVSKPLSDSVDNMLPIADIPEYTCLFVGVTGAAADTNVCGIEITMNIELEARQGNFAQHYATPPPRASPVIESTQQLVLAKSPSAMVGPVEVRSKSFFDYAAEALDTIEKAAPLIALADRKSVV